MKEDIIRMAQEAGFKRHHNPDLYDYMVVSDEAIERFAALVEDAQARRMHDEGMVTVGYMRQQIAAEREVCWRTAENYDTGYQAAAAIRARGQS
jgi:hypothetical protein